MILTIENEFIAASVNTTGAELSELRNKQDKTLYLYPEANNEWDGIAPVLFPNTGAVKDGGNIHGKCFPFRKHGFARDSEFEIVTSSKSNLTLRLDSNEITKILFPFDFSLSVTFTLLDRMLRISALTINTGNKPLYYSLGFHPGFSCPIIPGECAEDYSLFFHSKAKAARMILSEGLISKIEQSFLDGVYELPIREGMFNGGSFSLTDLNFHSVRLESRLTHRYIQIDFDEYPNLILWAPRNKPISTICIEPWYGRPDRLEGEPELAEKPDTIILKPAETKELCFSISMN